MSVQIPVRQDPQTQLAIQQLQQAIAAANKTIASLRSTTVINQSSSSSTSSGLPLTQQYLYSGTLVPYAAVYESSAGSVAAVDPTTVDDPTQVIGIVLSLTPTKATVQLLGDVTNSAWSWQVGEPVFAGANGVLTQLAPNVPMPISVGWATGFTSIFINPKALPIPASLSHIPATQTVYIPSGYNLLTLASVGLVVDGGLRIDGGAREL